MRLPAGKVLMPGLIAHSTNVVEHPELVAERLMRFVDCVGRDHLMAGRTAASRRVRPPAASTAASCGPKLRTLAEGVAIASKMAWG